MKGHIKEQGRPLAHVHHQSGEGRFRWLHAIRGRTADLGDACARYGDVAWVVTKEQVLDELTLTQSAVVSTGGGSVLRASNRQRLQERTITFYLHSTPDEVFKRLRHDQNRPLLQVADPLARLRDLYRVRDPLYRQSAHFVIETGRPSVASLVNMIVMQLELSGGAAAATGVPVAAGPNQSRAESSASNP
ncbi:MAG: shikimate kinase [Sphingobacteriia bacterium]|nr:shikimate kinase [Sphingobacteriia bacterium]